MPGSCDTHVHIFGDPARYSVVEGALYQPRARSVAEYTTALAPCGVKRFVVVQPSCYGSNNRCLLDTLAEAGGIARGVAGLDHSTSREDFAACVEQGVIGARFNSSAAGAVKLDELAQMTPTLKDFNLHAELFVSTKQLLSVADFLECSGLTVVIAHFGPVDPNLGPDQPAIRTLERLLETGRIWIKLSAPYRHTKDMGWVAQRFVEINPERLLWGSDWLYIQHEDALGAGYQPCRDLAGWIADEAVRDLIFYQNPRALYGFDRW